MHGFGRRWVVLALLLTIIPFALPVSAGTTHNKTVIKIGALIDQQQNVLSTSPLFTKAVELAALQMNQALALSGARVEFQVVYGDTKSVAANAHTLALDMINNQGVVGLLTASSGETQGVNKFNYGDPLNTTGIKVPITCFQCSSGFINDPTYTPNPPDALGQAAFQDLDKWLFRVFYNSNYEAAVLSQVIVNSGGDTNGDGILKVGVLHDGGHLALAQAITPALIGNFFPGGASAVSVTLTNVANSPDLATAWAQVMAGGPDVVVMAMLPASAGNGLKAYRAAGYTLPILSNNSFRRDYILADPSVGSVADGIEGSSVTLVDNSASGRAFVKAFEQYTGQKPELTSSGAYDGAMTLMLAALAAANDSRHPIAVTPGAVRDQLERINAPYALKIRPRVVDLAVAAVLLRFGLPINYEGAYNSDDWNEVGDIFPPLVHWKVVGGQFVEQEYYACDPTQPLCPVAP